MSSTQQKNHAFIYFLVFLCFLALIYELSMTQEFTLYFMYINIWKWIAILLMAPITYASIVQQKKCLTEFLVIVMISSFVLNTIDLFIN